MPNNAKKSAYKEREYRTYALWKSLPSHFHGLKKKQLESYGFTDPLIISILKIKNQSEFAKYFRIKDLGTLTDWNARIKKNELGSEHADSSSLEQANLTEPVTTMQDALRAQLENVERKISMAPNSILERKIERQQKIILKLKKEMESLRSSSIAKAAVRKSRHNAAPRSYQSPSPHHSSDDIQKSESAEKETFSKKLRRFFGW